MHDPPSFGALPDQGSADDFLGMLERFGGAGYWAIDFAAERFFWSEQVCIAHGVPSGYCPASLEEAIHWFHPDDRKTVNAAVDRSIQTGATFDFTLRIRRKSGETRWVECTGEARQDRAGDRTAITGTLRDVTARIEAEAELRRAAVFHERVTAAINEMSDAFVIFDTEDRLYICNEAYRRLYRESAEIIRPGVKFEDMVRFGVENGQYPDAIGREEEWLAERMRLHFNPQGAIVQQLPNGRWLRILEFTTRSGYRVGFRIDITKMKEMEARLQTAAREAMSANRLKDRFMANMSHELRTPLNAIIGFSQVMEMMAQQGDAPAKVGEYASDIAGAGHHLLGIIEGIFSLAQMEANEERIDLSPLPVHIILDDVRSLTGEMAQRFNKNVTFEDSICATLPVAVDKVKIAQVLVNLVSNAIKYSGDGAIFVRAIPGQAGHVLFQVADEGPGIALDKQHRIFDRFERLDAAKQAVEGIGIGLAIAKDLVTAMKGQIGVDSEPGVGSSFWVSIPMAEVVEQRIVS